MATRPTGLAETWRYVLLAYGITWLLVLPLVLEGLGWQAITVSPLWHGAGALGPVGAAFFMRRSGDRSTRLLDVYRREGEPSISRAWTAVIALSPLALLGLTLVGVAIVAGTPDFGGLVSSVSDSDWLGSLFVGSVLYGFGEEPGWRGWLLPHLQRARGAVASTLVLAVIWAGWHVPFFAYRFDLGGPGMVFGFFLGMLAGAFWLTFVFNSTGGSVLVVALWHTLWNVTNLVAAEISNTVLAVLTTLMMFVGFGVVAVWGRTSLTAGSASRPG